MSSFAVEDFEAIRKRSEELRAERDLALKGTSAPVTGQEPKEEASWAYMGSGLDYT